MLAEKPELPILLGGLAHVISDVDGLSALGDDGQEILEQVAVSVETFNDGGRSEISWGDLLFEDLGDDPMNPQLLFVRPPGDLSQMEPITTAMAAIRAHAKDLEARPGLRVRITGDRAVHTEEMSLVIQEAVIAGFLSLVLVTLVLMYALKSFRLLLATVLTLVLGLCWTAGMAGLLVGRLNALTASFAVLYIGLGVDFGIHFAPRLPRPAAARGRGRPWMRCSECRGEHVGSSLILCALTTAIGFYAFIPTAYSAVVAEMGIISGTGVLPGAPGDAHPVSGAPGPGDRGSPSEALGESLAPAGRGRSGCRTFPIAPPPRGGRRGRRCSPWRAPRRSAGSASTSTP